jgi:hypothetical protein
MANHRTQVKSVGAGHIGAIIGLRFTVTGDTLCDKKDPVVFESMHFPPPVISMAVEPKTTAEKDKLSDVLTKLAREDPTFAWRVDEATGKRTAAALQHACRTFLHREIPVAGILRRDERVPESIRRQAPLLLRYPNSAAAIDATAKTTLQIPMGQATMPMTDVSLSSSR